MNKKRSYPSFDPLREFGHPAPGPLTAEQAATTQPPPLTDRSKVLVFYALTVLGMGLGALRVQLLVFTALLAVVAYAVRRDVTFCTFISAVGTALTSFILYKPDIYFLYVTIGAGLFIARMAFVNHQSRRLRITVSRICYISFMLLLILTFYLNRYVYRGYGRAEVFLHGSKEFKVVALTFDDGPDPAYTPQVLKTLKEYGVKATFFMVGRHAELYPETARHVAEDGHEIGNHTYSHRQLLPLSKEKIEDEIVRCDEALYLTTGKRPTLFRPPRGLLGSSGLEVVKDLRYTLVLWSLSSEDWTEATPHRIARRIVSRVKPGDIILFHDSGDLVRSEGGTRSNTARALSLIIPALQKEGYSFVTVTQMMAVSSLTSEE